LQIFERKFSVKIGNSERLFKQVNIYTRNINGCTMANNELFYVLKISRFMSKEEIHRFAVFLKEKLQVPQNKTIDIINITKIQTITKHIENYEL